ncbi:MAG: fasciclin domain-containing protein [Phormidesmis sp.]
MKSSFSTSTARRLSLLALLLFTGIASVFAFNAPSAAQFSIPAFGLPADADPTIAEILTQSGGEYDDNGQDFDILLNAFNQTDIILSETDDFLVFAPTDAAFLKLSRYFGYGGNDEAAVIDIINKEFAKLNRIDVENGGSNPEVYKLRDLLLYHISIGARDAAELPRSTDKRRTIDPLMYPESNGFYVTYYDGSLLDSASGLINPKLQEGLTDIQAANGIIHGIDRVLFPFSFGSAYPIYPKPLPQAGEPATIMDIIAQSGEFDDNGQDFDILLKLVQVAELTDVLADPNADLTLFAPTDAAIIKFTQNGSTATERDTTRLEAGAYENVINNLQIVDQFQRRAVYGSNADAIALLQTGLKYHVSPGAKTAAQIRAASTINTLLEGATITPKDGNLVDQSPNFGDPQLQTGKTDIAASNGTIQAIDAVLIPALAPSK